MAQAATAGALRRHPATTAAPAVDAARQQAAPFGDGSTTVAPGGRAAKEPGDKDRPPAARGPATSAPSSAARRTARSSAHWCGHTAMSRAVATDTVVENDNTSQMTMTS